MASYLDKTFAKLNPLLSDQLVEICINPDGRVWVENRGDPFMGLSDVTYTTQEIMGIGSNLAADGNVRMSDKHPLGSASVTYREWLVRAQIIKEPVVREATAISMRFFRPGQELFEPAYLSGSPESASKMRRALNEKVAVLAETDLQAALSICVSAKLNVVVSGGTSSGKTNVARWLVSKVSDDERIITIEDVPDLMPSQPNKVMMISDRESDVRSPDKLLQATLRMRPDRIILSEVTGADAYTFLKAINTGHGGSITTVHADTAELAIERIAQTALEAKANMMYQDMVSYVQRSIDVIVHVGKRDGRRGVFEVFLPERFDPNLSLSKEFETCDS